MVVKNKLEVRGNVTAIFIERSNGEILETLISSSDIERVSSFPNTWTVSYSDFCKSYYVMGCLADRKNINMQRWIMQPSDGFVVDHINHDTLNNTRDNLRVVTHTINQLNRKNAKGVYQDKRNGLWIARLQVNGKRKVIGCFRSEGDALKAFRSFREKTIQQQLGLLDKQRLKA